MKVVDANVLLYAVNADASKHVPSHRWLEAALAGGDSIGFSWVVLLAFTRLVTKPLVTSSPMSSAEAFDQVDSWLSSPNALVLQPAERHQHLVGELLKDVGTAGNLVNDAHIAALALENRASVVTYDNDFARFTGVRWHRPDDLLSS